jgi:hypothetical protein
MAPSGKSHASVAGPAVKRANREHLDETPLEDLQVKNGPVALRAARGAPKSVSLSAVGDRIVARRPKRDRITV